MPFLNKIVRKFSNQTMTYWRKTDSNAYGKATFADPVELACRWEDKQQEVELAGGRTVTSQSYILLGTKITVGSLVFKGTKADWKALPTYPELPRQNQGGREVIKVNETPDLKAQETLFEAYL